MFYKTVCCLLFIVLNIVFTTVISGCAQNFDHDNGEPQWDFDHKLQFRETKLTEQSYFIEILPNDKTSFSQLSVFLIRRAMQLCLRYGYKIEVLNGVEGYDHKRSFPNMIMAKLSANIECPKAEN